MTYTHLHHAVVNGDTRHLGGWKRDMPDHRDFKASTILKAPLKLPALANVNEYNIPVFDQKDVGSCTANGTIFCYTQLGCSLKRPMIILSRLLNYYMTRTRYEYVAPNDDSGAQVRNAVKCLAKYGSCLEAYWPYDPNPSVRFAIKPSLQATKDATNHMLLTYSSVRSLQELKQAITTNHAVVGGFTCFDNLYDDSVAKTGVILAPTNNNYVIGGHCVAFTGYDDKKQLLKFRNSWGKTWGNKGSGFLPYSYIAQGLATDFWMMTAEK